MQIIVTIYFFTGLKSQSQSSYSDRVLFNKTQKLDKEQKQKQKPQ